MFKCCITEILNFKVIHFFVVVREVSFFTGRGGSGTFS